MLNCITDRTVAKLDEKQLLDPHAELDSLTIADMDWQACYIVADFSSPFNPLSSGAYASDQTSSSLHVREISSTYTLQVGFYSSFLVTHNVISLVFEGKVKSGHENAVNLIMAVYDNQTKMMVKLVPLIANGYEYCYHSSGLESPYVTFTSTFVLNDVTEALLFFHYEDTTSAIWNQEFWIQNLVLKTDIVESSLLSEQTTKVFSSPSPLPRGITWKDGYLLCANTPPRTVVKLDPTTGSILEENTVNEACGLTFDGTFYWTSYSSPTRDFISKYDSSFNLLGTLDLPFTDISGLSNDGVNLWVTNFNTDLIYKINKDTGSIISSIPAPGTSSRGIEYLDGFLWVVDSDSHQFFKIAPSDGTILETYTSDFEYLFGITIDDQGYIWLSSMICNLIIKTSINVNPDTDTYSSIIFSSGNLEYILDTFGNYISWVLEDANPDNYTIYRDGIMVDSDSWLNGDNISLNVDLLPVGEYNYTIIVDDLYENRAVNTIIVTVVTERTSISYAWSFIVALLLLPILLKRKRKSREK